MARKTQDAWQQGPLHIWVEIGVVALTILFGAIVIIGSLQVGITWGLEGPKAGFFPFYLGLLIILAGIVNFIQIMAVRTAGLFAEWGQLRQVVAVVVPTTIYVALIPYIGLYVASALLIAVFMKWLGRYGWALVIAVSVGITVLNFLMFEKWFLVPLPKGPIEELLGF